MSTLTFGFIGLGLIGGSIARAIRQNLRQSQIIAYDINADTLREASQCGVANTVTTKIDASFSACDYLFLCAPVQKNDENLSAVKEILSSKTLLTDVGSVKSEIHTEIMASSSGSVESMKMRTGRSTVICLRRSSSQF